MRTTDASKQKQMQQSSKTRHDNAKWRPLKARHQPTWWDLPSLTSPNVAGHRQVGVMPAQLCKVHRSAFVGGRVCACVRACAMPHKGPSHSSLTVISDCRHFFFVSGDASQSIGSFHIITAYQRTLWHLFMAGNGCH